MSDRLSQAELDALVDEMKSGANKDRLKMEKTESARIRQYDFSKPNIFGRDQMRMLNMIHDEYGSDVSGFLSRHLRSPFKVELVEIEAMTYREFTNSLSVPSVLSVINVPPLKGSMILDFPPRISSVIIDSALGGFGDSDEEVSEFTEIEISIIQGILEQLTGMLKKPWDKVVDLSPSLDRVETDPQMVQLASLSDIMILASYKSSINNVNDFIRICIPHQIIDPIAASLGTRQWHDHDGVDGTKENDKVALMKKIINTEVEVRAELGKNTITLGDLTSLQAGDVISLGKNINSSLEVYVGDSLKFKGKPGISNSRYSIEVTEIARKTKNNRQV